jgi:hypothetical protein
MFIEKWLEEYIKSSSNCRCEKAVSSPFVGAKIRKVLGM